MDDHLVDPGARVGAWRLQRPLGEGASGVVYEATDDDGQRVAVKVLRLAAADDATQVARFVRESQAIAALHHPNIVAVLATGTLADGRPYLVMPRLEGQSLRALLDARGRLSTNDAWSIARQIAMALGAAHAADVVHRDVKPDNVFVTDAGAVMLLDFGVAKALKPDADLARLTATGTPLGTPAYMAPEQWWGAAPTAAVDQYALGVTLYEMLSGQRPFEAQSLAALVQAHVNTPPPPVGAHVPDAVEALIARALAKTPAQRFASMAALVEAGDRAFGHTPTPPRVLVTPAPTHDRLPPIARVWERYVATHAALLGGGSVALVLVGYAGAGRHSPAAWVLIGGFAQYGTLTAALVASVALVLVARRRARTRSSSVHGFWLVLAPGLLGTFATYTGWRAILAHLPRPPAVDRYTTFCEGMYEANACRFVGFALAALLALSLAAMPAVSDVANATTTLSRALGVRRGEALVAAALFAAVTALSVVLGAPSAALLGATCAALFATQAALPTLHTETAARDEFERSLAGLLAVTLMAAAALTRLEAREAALWNDAPTRAARVAELIAAARERRVTGPVAGFAFVMFIAVEALRLRRLSRHGVLAPPRPRAVALLAALAAGVAVDVTQHGRFFGERERLRSEFASQFALFARLDPPGAAGLDARRFKAHPSTGLQVTREAIAVEGRATARLGALASPEGSAVVTAELSRALGTAAVRAREAPAVDLSITIDHAVPGAVVARVLSLARRCGVRRAELLLTRGEPLRLPEDAPAEARAVVPRDFVGLPVELGDEGVGPDASSDYAAFTRVLTAAPPTTTALPIATAR